MTLTLTGKSRTRLATIRFDPANEDEVARVTAFAKFMQASRVTNGFVFTQARGVKTHALLSAGFCVCPTPAYRRPLSHPATGGYHWAVDAALQAVKLIK